MMDRISLDIGFAKLTVEIYKGDYPVSEICICLEDDKNIQDVAVIRQVLDSDKPQKAVECLVYSDKDNEDYTHKFKIERHIEWEE